ncbi:Imm1 family immunity protein [Microlunatus speluncae]|uniref:Imm1 family immunity protein n=1 Tax=Microlunatus speluncae TaxID=2594267 RepID=UPI00126650C9|nr:Imm1 family immunity protein [Microlunatus speluncae]
MSSSGPTRKRRRRPPKFRRLRPLDLWLLLIPVAMGIAVPVIFQARPDLTITVIVLALALGFGSVLLPRIAREVLMWVLGFGGALAWGLLNPLLALSWLVLFPCGLALGGHLRAVRAGTGKRPTTTGDGDPSGPAPDRMVCNPGEDEDEVVLAAPSPEAVSAAIDALDGSERTVISLFRGPARLDLSGSAAGPMMVYFSADHAARRPEWSHLTTPGAADSEVAIRFSEAVGHFRAWQTTTLEPAKLAAAEFLESGDRSPALSWRTDADVADLRPPGLDPD